jgi:hypothetical protein
MKVNYFSTTEAEEKLSLHSEHFYQVNKDEIFSHNCNDYTKSISLKNEE